MTYKELGYDSFAERRTLPDLSPLETPNLTSLEGGDAIGGLLLGDGNTFGNGLPITSGNVGDVMGDKVISFDKLDLVIGQGVNTVGMSGTGAESTSIRIWAGETFGNRGSAPFRVTAAGAVTASSISIIGGDVGGWVITPTTLYGLSSGTPTVAPNDGIVMTSGATANIRIYEDTEERIRLGNLAAGIYGLRGFATDGLTTIFELSDTLQQIAGWNFTNTVLRTGATDAASNVLIDSANSLMRLGPTTGNSISMDGANQRVRSSNYVAGVSGFTVEPLLIEAQNILARGTMSGTVFRYDVINATGGRQIVANADALASAMTALDASTLTTRGNVTLAVNDILIIRAQTALGIQEEYLRVTGVGAAPTYTVTRDLAGSFAADTNPVWPAGTPVVQLGVSDGAAAFSGGWLDLVGEASAGVDWPRLSVIQRTGVAYNAFTERVRVGNLNGYLGYAADTFGVGIGSSVAGEANITIEPTNGLRIRTGTTTLMQVDMAGTATIGSFTLAATTISATNLSLISGAANVANITVGTGATAGGLNSANAGGDIIFWGGDTFANRATAPFRVTAAGALTATSGAIAAFTIAATTLSATNLTLTSGAANTANITVGTGANAGGLNSANASDDIVFWAGSTFANRASAAYNVTAGGAVTCSNITITGGAITASAATFNGSTTTATGANLNTLTDGSNADALHEHTHLLATSRNIVNNADLETTILSFSLGGGLLSGAIVNIKVHVSDFDLVAERTWTFRLKYGATTVATATFITGVGGTFTSKAGMIEAILLGVSASAQDAGLAYYFGNANTSDAQAENVAGDGIENSAGALTVALTMQHSGAGGDGNMTADISYATLIN